METKNLCILDSFGSGKSTYIEALSEWGISGFEREIDGQNVALNFGKLTLSENHVLYLLANVGNSPLGLWPTHFIHTHALGYLVLLPSRVVKDEVIRDYIAGQLLQIMPFVRRFAWERTIFVANHLDHANALSLEKIRETWGLLDHEKLVPCNAKDVNSVISVFMELLTLIHDDEFKSLLIKKLETMHSEK